MRRFGILGATGQAYRPAPLPPSCFAGRSPFPASRGRMGSSPARYFAIRAFTRVKENTDALDERAICAGAPAASRSTPRKRSRRRLPARAPAPRHRRRARGCRARRRSAASKIPPRSRLRRAACQKAPQSQRSVPWPSTKTVPTARYGPSGDDGANIASPVIEPRSLSKIRPAASRTTTALL